MIVIEHVPHEMLKDADYNPRQIDERRLDALCRSIVEFGLVDPVIARREDQLVIGGHQRLRAMRRLLAGDYKVRGKAAKVAERTIPVVYLDGITDARAKQLNIALNKIGGEWDYAKLGDLVAELTNEGTDIDLPIGFTQAEIADVLDVREAYIEDPGVIPQHATGAPKLTIDFSTKELRDSVKAHLAARAEDGVLTGDCLARLLGVGSQAPARPGPGRRSRRAV